MRIFKVPGLHIAFLILFCLAGKSYSQNQDAGLWANILLEKKFTQKFSVTLNNEVRFNENVTEPGTFFTDAGLNYKLIPSLTLGANYRYAHSRRLDDSYSQRHRYYFDLSYRLFKIKQIAVSLRGRYQSQYKDYFVSERGAIPTNYLRSRIAIKYNPEKKYKPYFTVEAWYPLNNNTKELIINNLRATLGVDYELNVNNQLNFFYLVQREMNVNRPMEDFVVGIGYQYSF